MVEVDTIVLEDNITYIVVDEIKIDNTTYVYLSNENDISKFCIRKKNIINEKNCLVGLKDKEEFEKALNGFIEKHHNSL